MDVLDLDWSPRGYLASGSIDNKILIWDVPSLKRKLNESAPYSGNSTQYHSLSAVLTPVQTLTKHSSFVKGISFDPIGKYLASCGSDNMVIIWDCDNWSEVQSLSEPMEGIADRSIFRRMSWAPDGSSLCISSATKSSKPVGMVLRRGTWESTVGVFLNSRT